MPDAFDVAEQNMKGTAAPPGGGGPAVQATESPVGNFLVGAGQRELQTLQGQAGALKAGAGGVPLGMGEVQPQQQFTEQQVQRGTEHPFYSLSDAATALHHIPTKQEAWDALRTAYEPLQDISEGRTAKGLGKFAVDIANLALAKWTGGKAMGSALPGRSEAELQGPMTPKQYRAAEPIKSPAEQAEGVRNAVNPQQSEYNSYAEAVQHEAGNIKDFARRSGIRNPDKMTLPELQKAADGASNETMKYYKLRMLNPYEDVQTDAPPGFKGRTVGEGRRTTLGYLDERAAAINKEIRDNYMKRNVGQVGTATQGDAELHRELNGINDRLIRGISENSDIPAEDVRAVRQRMGRQYQIAYQTQEAINSKIGRLRTAEENVSLAQHPVRAVVGSLERQVRGGPLGVANRALQRVLPGVNIPATELPESAQPGAATPFESQARSQAAQALGSEPAELGRPASALSRAKTSGRMFRSGQLPGQ